ncbi:hypothetical protein PHMEG_00021296 [Phytophthora megakarya]|uniref:Eukaryotic/viral aspartic protease n=1 Tax=Phytophthora megakarya TaxID=4795 RepID=A0A225VM93_9STRA|nr:hypothetical protein PHMEG_00021296 [Phytophthora megakarya]
MSDSENYNTMKQRKAMAPLGFLYRLNAAADRADIRYKKSERRHKQHVKRFTYRLADSQLKSILKSQRFKSMDDLEYVLKQQEDDWDDDSQSVPSTKARDFRADNLRQGRLKTKYPERAYATQSGDDSDPDERHVIFEDEVLENSPAQESAEFRESPPENQGPGMTILTHHVLKVMENSGWNKPGHMAQQGKARQSNGNPGSPSPRYDDPDRDMRCDNCNGIGRRADNCWADLICENSHRTGHPTQLCKTLPCKKCGKFHDGRCDNWEMLESIARLARQGIVQDLPTPMLGRLLAVKADPGDGSLNH